MEKLKNGDWYVSRSCGLITTALVGILSDAGCGDKGSDNAVVLPVDTTSVDYWTDKDQIV